MNSCRTHSTLNAITTFLIAALSLTALAACSESRESSDESAEAAAAALDVCGLVKAEQIEEALSQEPGEPAAGMMGSALTCVWPAADGSNPRLVHLLIGERTASTYEEYLANARQQMGDHFQDHSLEKVEGIGDFAVFANFGETGLLQVFAGGHLVQVSAGPGAHRSAQQNCMKLAREVLKRIS